MIFPVLTITHEFYDIDTTGSQLDSMNRSHRIHHMGESFVVKKNHDRGEGVGVYTTLWGDDHITVTGHVRSGMGYRIEFQTENRGPLTTYDPDVFLYGVSSKFLTIGTVTS